MKFRIVEYTHHVHELKLNPSKAEIEYVIERKGRFRWKEISQKEIKDKKLSYKTYQEAEAYMFSEYMGCGWCKKTNNIYEYQAYTLCYF